MIAELKRGALQSREGPSCGDPESNLLANVGGQFWKVETENETGGEKGPSCAVPCRARP